MREVRRIKRRDMRYRLDSLFTNLDCLVIGVSFSPLLISVKPTGHNTTSMSISHCKWITVHLTARNNICCAYLGSRVVYCSMWFGSRWPVRIHQLYIATSEWPSLAKGVTLRPPWFRWQSIFGSSPCFPKKYPSQVPGNVQVRKAPWLVSPNLPDCR